MAGQVIALGNHTRSTKKLGTPVKGDGFSFTAEVDKDIDKLSEKLGVSKEKAIDIATDFYRCYPMLMEHVRSPQHLLRK